MMNKNINRSTQLKRLSNYKLKYGLQYKLKGKRPRNKITYKCLSCGKTFTTDLETAWKYRFSCENCAELNPNFPLKENTKYRKLEKINNKETSYYKTYYKMPTLADNYIPSEFEDKYVKIIIMPINKPLTKKKCFFSWIKNLLHIK